MTFGGLRTKGIHKKSLPNEPLITVVTVVRNGEAALGKTILSVINQTYRNLEYIVIDGASTDGTVDIIKKHEDKIDYWVSDPDGGIYDAMNKGIDLAAGEWINFMNSDDWFYNNDVIADVFKTQHEADIIYGDTYMRTSYFQYIEKEDHTTLGKSFTMSHQSTFVKLSLMKEKHFDLLFKLGADYNFFYQCFNEGKSFEHIPVVVASYQQEYGFSLNIKLALKENARIHGVDKTIKFKLYYYYWCLRILIKDFIYSMMPKSLENKIHAYRLKHNHR